MQAVFTNVDGAEYEKLKYMAAKAFLENEKRRKRFLSPDKYNGYTEEEWNGYFREAADKKPRPKQHDLVTYADLADQAGNGAFETSGLEALKAYILDAIP